MAGMQETDHITLKNGITYLLQDAKARAKLAELLVEVMEKYGADNPPPYPVTSINGQTGDVDIPTVDLPVSVQNGGTGATTAAAARTNLGAVSKSGDTMTGDLSVQKNGEASVYSNNTAQGRNIRLCAGASGRAGIYDDTHEKWLIDYDSAGNLELGDALPITSGGTGANNAADARANLAVPNMQTETFPALLPPNGSNNWIKIGKANSSYGLLPSQAGGHGSGHNSIGASTWYWSAAYVDNYYGSWKGDTIPVDKGGTGATTAAAARTNLGAVAKSGDTMTGDLTVQKQGEANIYADNTKSGEAHKISLCAGSSGIGGVWDATLSKWLIGLDRSGFFYCADRVSQIGGELERLVSNGQLWLCIGMRNSVAESIVVLAHMYSGTMYTNTIYKTTNMSVATNNQGTVSLRYGGSTAVVFTCAIRLC